MDSDISLVIGNLECFLTRFESTQYFSGCFALLESIFTPNLDQCAYPYFSHIIVRLEREKLKMGKPS